MKIYFLVTFALGAAIVGSCGGKQPLTNDGGAGGRGGSTGTGGAGSGVSPDGGMSGAAGVTGAAGVAAAAGASGAAGAPGAAGTVGSSGAAGKVGTAGASGAAGTVGTAGTVGGAAGVSGAAGVGAAGATGGQGGQRPPYVPTVPITAGDKPFTNPTNVSGTWTGYFENFHFRSGSDLLVLKFGKDAQGQSTLRVVMGEGVPPAPPTDPTKRWPASLDFDTFSSAQELEGIEYPAHEVRWQGQRLTFKLATAEPWAPWCGLQTSYALSERGGITHNCVPGNGGSFSDTQCDAQDNGKHTIVPCDQFHMCSGGYCTCNATGCGPVVDHDRAYDITFNSANLASGSGYLEDGLRNLHLMASSN